MTDKERMLNLLIIVTVSALAGTCFGFWQHSIAAGFFAGLALGCYILSREL